MLRWSSKLPPTFPDQAEDEECHGVADEEVDVVG
jgi:hypothetical protein